MTSILLLLLKVAYTSMIRTTN